jgi:hypothetical protein
LALGHGTKTSLNTPRIIQSLEGKRIRDIAVGREFSMALTSSGEVYVWGKGSAALGLGSNADEPYPRHNTALSVCFSLSVCVCVCVCVSGSRIECAGRVLVDTMIAVGRHRSLWRLRVDLTMQWLSRMSETFISGATSWATRCTPQSPTHHGSCARCAICISLMWHVQLERRLLFLDAHTYLHSEPASTAPSVRPTALALFHTTFPMPMKYVVVARCHSHRRRCA